VSLRRQGANKGATTAFLISTPESGVDSIAVTYALLDPLMTVMRPLAAFVTAAVAGVAENLIGGGEKAGETVTFDRSCPVDGCCDGVDCPPDQHSRHHSMAERMKAGLGYAFGDLWADMAIWFFIGLLLAGIIMAWLPPDLLERHLGSGLPAMLFMLIVGIPLYICATASTPIAAALILKGVSPGAALVFLLTGPATNVTSLTVLLATLGKRATALYFASIAICSVCIGLLVDQAYALLGLSAAAAIGEASELIPAWLQGVGTALLVLLSMRLAIGWLRRRQEEGYGGQGAEGCMDGSGTAHPAEYGRSELSASAFPPEKKGSPT
jgi:uncharacterized membrane protein YraQ (UPF0718 family)